MPKNHGNRQRRAREIQDSTGAKYTRALHHTGARTSPAGEITPATGGAVAPVDGVSRRPSKVQIEGQWRYVRRRDAEELGQDGLADPVGGDVVAAADALLPHLRAVLSAPMDPVTVPGRDGRPGQLVQCRRPDDVREKVQGLVADVERVRDTADIAHVDAVTVRAARWVRSRISGLWDDTAGPLQDHVDTALTAAADLAIVAEAVYNRGCLLGAGDNRPRRQWGYSPCGGGPVRVRVRIFDFDDTIVTVPGCPRHAAEELVHWDYQVDDGDAGVEIMGGDDQDLDLIYALAEEVRFERQRRRETQPAGSQRLPEPPWMDPDAR
ncbi:hypothetical protein [Nocardia sp. alder85J]|uniref:hypothetical protein n=1 Tax=Nocardia sp. alder85J TaxID=2862949 RepID=UPI001CD63099|nr:hypothetical protein [Nocardia sp. alder85J]MCX4097728.1 hypothetical protein [Nocardia sp. alder85J]